MNVLSTNLIPMVPAPWTLQGSGYLLFYRFAADLLVDQPLPFPRELGSLKYALGVVMFVDYRQSDVGPYQELLIIPGPFAFDRGLYGAITRIYVSSQESVVNGRKNWGIPKEQARFSLSSEDQCDRVLVGSPDQPMVDLRFKPSGFRFPVTTALIPRRLRTVMQPFEGRYYKVLIGARGWVRPARLVGLKVDPCFFPDFSRSRLLAAFQVSDFRMQFPIPQILPWPGSSR